jgi:hypothetical protein
MTFIEEVNILEIIYFLFFNWSLVWMIWFKHLLRTYLRILYDFLKRVTPSLCVK